MNKKMSFYVLLFLGLSVLLVMNMLRLPLAHAQGTIRYVAPGGACGGVTPCYSTVQAAVDAAQPGDEIRVAAGVYTGINNYGGLAQVVYIDKSLTIRGGYTTTNWDTPNPNTNPTELNAQTLGRVMVISGTVEATVEGLHLIYGNATGLKGHPGYPLADKDAGGAIYVNGAAMNLSHTRVMSNAISGSGSLGGGIYLRYALATISNCTIQGNSSGHGAALYFVHTQATLRQNVIQDNAGTSGISEGATLHIRSSSDVTLANNTIQNNTRSGSMGFGSIYMKGSRAIFTENLMANNQGEGIYAEFGNVITMTGNTIHGHSSTGVFIHGSDSLIVDNIVENNGQGMHIWHGGHSVATIIEGNVIQNNQNKGFHAQGGGVYLDSSDTGPITLAHNIIQDNVSGLGSVVPAGNGGGVYIDNENITLQGNIIRRNRANEFCHSITGCENQGRGAGVYVSSRADNVVLMNNMVINNQAEGKGSGICIIGSSPTLYHNTIANNSGPVDPEAIGVYVAHTSSGQVAQPKFYNTIIAGQTTGIEVNGGALNIAVIDGILWWGNTTNTGGGGTSLITNEDTDDPAFANPGGYDYHIVGPGSAAVDAGLDKGITTDVDRETRPHYNGYDLGADEWWPLVAIQTVTPDTAEPGDVVTYTLTLTNTTDVAVSVYLTDTLPSQVSYLGLLEYNNGNGDYAAGVVTWNGSVLSGTPTLITWAVQVTTTVSPGAVVSNNTLVQDAYGLFQTDPASFTVGGLAPGQQNIYLPIVLRSKS